MTTNIIKLILISILIQNIYGKSYFISDVFFNKYQEIYDIPQTGFYIEYTKVNEIEKFSLFKDLKLIKYKTQKKIENNKKQLTFYNEKDIKIKEEIYDELNNKIKEIKYSPKGIILESVDYFYKNNDVIYKEIKILNQKPKTIHYMKDTNGKLLKITGSDLQIWNYGINGEIKSTYLDIKKSKTKVIQYDDQKRHLKNIILDNNKIVSKENNQYLDDNEIINVKEEDNTKIISKYKDHNLIKQEVYKDNKITKICDFEYNESGHVTMENVIIKDEDKEYTTKTTYEYDSDDKLISKTIYENDLISLKTDYFSDNEYEQKIYHNGNPIFTIRYKNDEIIEQINTDTRDKNETK
ncbi:hypothetical protein ACE4V3_03905 [Borrelia recurrentis]|uniref:Uncharacterized conserved protein n=1 Tax=Borrelia recurrentis (strain A1) TaxID=412418 RepID=B5RQQ6_BORRA|nr:hypothetical protein [Borrelia recurrentis]ACH94340.1 uncharacterized conserved protein [Borrelia recurrentis A1]